MLSLDLIQIWCELDVRGERTVLDFRFSRKKNGNNFAVEMQM